MSNFFLDWFFQLDEFTADIEEMNQDEASELVRCKMPR